MTVPTAAETGVVVPLTVATPFSFAHTLGFLSRFPAMTGEQEIGDGTLTYALRAGGRTVGVQVGAAAPGLELRLTAAGLDRATVSEIVDRVGFYMGTDDDLPGFYARADGDPAFESVITRLHGYHQVKFPSPLELLVWAIVGQRVPMAVARTMKRALVEHFDNRITVNGSVHVAFPDPAQLRELDERDYRELIGNQRKASYLAGAVRGFTDLDEAFLRHGDEAAVREALLALPGIGPWSAGFLMVRGLGRAGELSPDREGKRAASRVYGHAVEDTEFHALADRYGPWRGYWGHYLRVDGSPATSTSAQNPSRQVSL